VFDLGADGKEPAKRVAELTDFLTEVSRLPTGRSVFAPGEDKRGTAIKYLAVIRECCWVCRPGAAAWCIYSLCAKSCVPFLCRPFPAALHINMPGAAPLAHDVSLSIPLFFVLLPFCAHHSLPACSHG
jgi:hypothetical protein